MTALFDQDEVIGTFANGAAYAKHSRAKTNEPYAPLAHRRVETCRGDCEKTQSLGHN